MDQHWARPRSLSLQYFMFIIWAGFSLIILYFIFVCDKVLEENERELVWRDGFYKHLVKMFIHLYIRSSSSRIGPSLFLYLASSLGLCVQLRSSRAVSLNNVCAWAGPAASISYWSSALASPASVSEPSGLNSQHRHGDGPGPDTNRDQTHENEKWAWAGGHLSKQESALNISWEPLGGQSSHI